MFSSRMKLKTNRQAEPTAADADKRPCATAS